MMYNGLVDSIGQDGKVTVWIPSLGEFRTPPLIVMQHVNTLSLAIDTQVVVMFFTNNFTDGVVLGVVQ